MLRGKISLLFWSLLLVLSNVGYSQISPGDLVQAHAHLEGLTNCTECHVLGDQVRNEKCLKCHTEIKNRIDQKKGYHASAEVQGKTCASCHNDHHGRNFEIIHFNQDAFKHNLTGYELLGKHSEIKCQDCHKAEFIKDQKLIENKKTFLGLEKECLNCHADYHQGSLSKNCTDCHNHQAFKPAPLFEHSKTKYSLRGKHKNVDCIKCHIKEVRNGKEYQKFSGLKFENCTSCHKDTHQNKFGQNCTDCHSENSFHEVKQIANFNHDKTNYPLKGKHQKVDCKKCHIQRNLTEPMAFKNCTDCHVDYHKNELDIKNSDPNCTDCHSVNGFTPSTYTIEKHNQTDFVLRDAHIATPCFSCHVKKETWHFKSIGKTCVDCHEDIHKGLIGEKFYPEQDCKGCHLENQWKTVKFNHDLTEFKLKGAHQKQTCRACHFPKTEAGIVNQKFALLKGNCLDCHKDKHYQQFDISGVTDCMRCHGFEKWTDTHFDHNKTLFPIDGAHKKVTCKECHKETINQQGKYIIYKIKEYKCADCHS